jgi:diguanylate cyclase (GGDEF)-like protein
LSSATKQNILIVDDSPEVIRFLSMLLSDQAGINFATRGEEGLALARKLRPDLILLDVALPDIDGFEVCRRLKSDMDTSGIPVLFVTAGSDVASEVMGLEIGAVDFLAKPLNPPIVRARIRTQLALRAQTQQLEAMVNKDGLTGIFNRRYLDSQLTAEVARHRRQRLPMAVALIDVDHFKRYNDSLGHQRGDECLQAVARTLEAATRRPGETVARYGGEEFVVLMPACSAVEADRYGNWIRERIAAINLPHPDSPTAKRITISAGIAAGVPDSSHDAASILALADQALYVAKNDGRDGHRLSTW